MSPLPGAVVAALALTLAAAAFGAPVLAPYAARRLPPPVAAILLTVLALTVALVGGLVLSLTAMVALAQAPGLSGLGHWSPEAVRARVPVPLAVGVAAALAAAVLLGRACLHLARVTVHARRACAAAAGAPAPGGLVVVTDQRLFAYAIPGRHRRIVASTAMLARLTPLQRRILLAHEAAHLRLRHHHYVQLGRLAAAANPLLRPVSSAIDLSVERWADENAAREAGDRTATARALLAAASAGPAGPQPGGALHAAQAHLPDRVACLLRRPAPHPLLATVLLVAALAAWVAGCLLTGHVHALLELAEAA